MAKGDYSTCIIKYHDLYVKKKEKMKNKMTKSIGNL